MDKARLGLGLSVGESRCSVRDLGSFLMYLRKTRYDNAHCLHHFICLWTANHGYRGGGERGKKGQEGILANNKHLGLVIPLREWVPAPAPSHRRTRVLGGVLLKYHLH